MAQHTGVAAAEHAGTLGRERVDIPASSIGYQVRKRYQCTLQYTPLCPQITENCFGSETIMVENTDSVDN